MNIDGKSRPLLIAATHPVQYHAPVYQAVAAMEMPLVVVYGSDYSVAGSLDPEFGAKVKWDTDLLSGYESRFLSKVSEGGAKTYPECRADGLERIIDDVKPAAMMILGYSSAFDREAMKIAFRTGLPLMFRAETTDHASNRGWLKSLARDWVLRRRYRRFDRLLPIGKRSRSHYLRLGVPESKLIDAKYCVNTAPFQLTDDDREKSRDATRRAWGVEPDRKVILFSGKLSHRKGVDLLGKAAQAIAKQGETIALVFLGHGELREQLEKELGSDSSLVTQFLGFKNQSELSEVYHAADLMALPSRHSETWGLVVNEALHHGLPVVVTEMVGSAADLVKPGVTGEIAKPDDLESLTNSLRRVLSWCRRDGVRDDCRNVVQDYTVDAAAKGLKRAFMEII